MEPPLARATGGVGEQVGEPGPPVAVGLATDVRAAVGAHVDTSRQR